MIPEKIVAGDTLSFLTTVANYPASGGWTLTHALIPRNASNDVISFSATAQDIDYTTTVAASVTSQWIPDTYTWTAYIALSGQRYTVDGGSLVVAPDLTQTDPGYDSRTQAQTALDAINAQLQKRATADQQEYEISVGGSMRRVVRANIAQLIAAKTYYEGIVANEQAASRAAEGLPDPRRSYVRFTYGAGARRFSGF